MELNVEVVLSQLHRWAATAAAPAVPATPVTPATPANAGLAATPTAAPAAAQAVTPTILLAEHVAGRPVSGAAGAYPLRGTGQLHPQLHSVLV
jgi:hypothetical protein